VEVRIVVVPLAFAVLALLQLRSVVFTGVVLELPCEDFHRLCRGLDEERLHNLGDLGFGFAQALEDSDFTLADFADGGNTCLLFSKVYVRAVEEVSGSKARFFADRAALFGRVAVFGVELIVQSS
jgi:hypothetical protein